MHVQSLSRCKSVIEDAKVIKSGKTKSIKCGLMRAKEGLPISTVFIPSLLPKIKSLKESPAMIDFLKDISLKSRRALRPIPTDGLREKWFNEARKGEQ